MAKKDKEFGDIDFQKLALKTIATESSFNPEAANKKSTAQGLFQFLEGNRSHIKKKYGEDLSTVESQLRAFKKFAKDEYYDFFKKKMDREPTEQDIYVMHLLGAPDGLKVINGERFDLNGPEAKKNRNIFGSAKTTDELYKNITSKFNEADSIVEGGPSDEKQRKVYDMVKGYYSPIAEGDGDMRVQKQKIEPSWERTPEDLEKFKLGLEQLAGDKYPLPHRDLAKEALSELGVGSGVMAPGTSTIERLRSLKNFPYLEQKIMERVGGPSIPEENIAIDNARYSDVPLVDFEEMIKPEYLPNMGRGVAAVPDMQPEGFVAPERNIEQDAQETEVVQKLAETPNLSKEDKFAIIREMQNLQGGASRSAALADIIGKGREALFGTPHTQSVAESTRRTMGDPAKESLAAFGTLQTSKANREAKLAEVMLRQQGLAELRKHKERIAMMNDNTKREIEKSKLLSKQQSESLKAQNKILNNEAKIRLDSATSMDERNRIMKWLEHNNNILRQQWQTN